jgi:hypothetical protein
MMRETAGRLTPAFSSSVAVVWRSEWNRIGLMMGLGQSFRSSFGHRRSAASGVSTL